MGMRGLALAWVGLGLLIVPVFSIDYEPTFPNLQRPGDLEPRSMIFGVQHAFYGDILDDPLDNLFGAESGANVRLFGRIALTDDIEWESGYTRVGREYYTGVNWTPPLAPIGFTPMIHLHYFNGRIGADNRRTGNLFGLIAITADPLWDQLTPVINLGYDGFFEEVGVGGGLEWRVLDQWVVLGEVFSSNGETDNDLAINVGTRIETFGHNFHLFVHNNGAIGPRRLMMGAGQGFWGFAFKIERVLEWD